MAPDSSRSPDERRSGRREHDDSSAEDGETLAEKIRRYRQPDAPAPRKEDRASRERGDP